MIADLISDKTKKAKEKVQTIGQRLLDGVLPIDELIVFAEKANGPDKATCIEAIELATRQNPGIADLGVLVFVTRSLAENAPRVKWECAKVIGNIAPLFADKLDPVLSLLLENAAHEGTVVRWASAFALGEILKLKTTHYKGLLPALESICDKEQDNGVKKKYMDVIKKAKK